MIRLLFLLVLFAPALGFAHGVADNHLQIMVVDNRVKTNIVVDMRVLGMADTDKDGYASLDELAARSAIIKDWARQAIAVANTDGSTGSVVFADLTSDLEIAEANGSRVDHARLLQTLSFDTTLTGLQINLHELVRRIPELRVTLIDAASGKRYRLRDPGGSQEILLPGRTEQD